MTAVKISLFITGEFKSGALLSSGNSRLHPYSVPEVSLEARIGAVFPVCCGNWYDVIVHHVNVTAVQI